MEPFPGSSIKEIDELDAKQEGEGEGIWLLNTVDMHFGSMSNGKMAEVSLQRYMSMAPWLRHVFLIQYSCRSPMQGMCF